MHRHSLHCIALSSQFSRSSSRIAPKPRYASLSPPWSPLRCCLLSAVLDLPSSQGLPRCSDSALHLQYVRTYGYFVTLCRNRLRCLGLKRVKRVSPVRWYLITSSRRLRMVQVRLSENTGLVFARLDDHLGRAYLVGSRSVPRHS
jgi:hypothetical protein